jgi:hypothetical protein
MSRFLVERTFVDGLHVPITDDGATACAREVERNAGESAARVHSYVNEDKSKTFCVYDGPDADAIRRAAEATGIPADRITRITVLDPYFYR